MRLINLLMNQNVKPFILGNNLILVAQLMVKLVVVGLFHQRIPIPVSFHALTFRINLRALPNIMILTY